MGSNALQDLNMAGVRWELAESSIKKDVKKSISPQSLLENTNRPTSQQVIVPASAPISLDTVKSMVARPQDIDSLLRMINEFNHPLRNTATNIVLPNIAKKPNGLLLITDIPSSDDDLSGQILSGTAGELVDKMLSAIEMSRQTVSIIPLVFWRTPGGRTPTREELDLARPFTDKILEFLQPHIIVTLGTLAATEIGQTNLTTKHGTEIQSDKGYTIIPIYHPNYLILKPSAKRDVWTALQNVQKFLKNQ
jgi:DNA polymerase